MMRVCVVLLCLAPCATGADLLQRESPQSSVIAFLQACHNHDYRRASRYLDLRKLPPTARMQQGAGLSEQLGQLLDSDTRFDEGSLSSQPDASTPERVASFPLNGTTQQIDMERITLRQGVSVWLFSPESVDAIPKLAHMASSSPLDRYMPGPLVSVKLLDTAAWRWIALGLAALVSWALARGVCLLGFLLSAPALKHKLRAENLAEFVDPARLLVGTLVFRALLEWVGASPVLRKYLDYIVSLLFFAAMAWLCVRALDVAALRLSRKLQQRHYTFAYSVLPMTARVSKVLIGVVATIAILSSWGYNTTALLAGLGVGGVAVALAAQKTIENLFGGVAVITDRPVMVGDYCKFGDRAGTVEDIGLRSTRIRTPERTLVTVPNGAFSTMTLENFSKKDKTWFHLMLNVRRDTTPDQMRDLMRSLSEILKRIPKIETGGRPVRFVGVGTYSLDIEIGVYLSTIDDDELIPIQEDLYLQILDAVEAAGTSLALPTQAYYTLGQRISNGAPGSNGAPSPQDETPLARR
jgi:MscS family membrane protein